MWRGDIYLIDPDPVRGHESNKTRPCVIVSNNNANQMAQTLGRGVVTVVPITSNVKSVYPFQVYLDRSDTGLDFDSKAQAEQVRSVDVRRLVARIGRVPFAQMVELDRVLKLHLALA